MYRCLEREREREREETKKKCNSKILCEINNRHEKLNMYYAKCQSQGCPSREQTKEIILG